MGRPPNRSSSSGHKLSKSYPEPFTEPFTNQDNEQRATRNEHPKPAILSAVKPATPSVGLLGVRQYVDKIYKKRDGHQSIVVTLKAFWEIPRLLRDQFQKDTLLSSVLTISGNGANAQAATCEKYIKQTWGADGELLLEGMEKSLRKLDNMAKGLKEGHSITTIIRDGVEGMHPLTLLLLEGFLDFVLTSMHHLAKNKTLSLKIHVTGSCVIVNAEGYATVVSNVAEALSWLCAAVRDSPSEGLMYSNVDPSILLKNDTIEIRLSNLKPLEPEKKSCWHSLFTHTVIVEGSFGRGRRFGYGLEIDFDTMIHLAAVEHPVRYNDGIVLLGFSTLLIPVKNYKTDNAFQWHLVTSDKGQIQLSAIDRAVGKDNWLKLSSDTKIGCEKAFLGWCDPCSVTLGTERLGADIPVSKAKVTDWVLEWDSIGLALALALPAGIARFTTGISASAKIKRNSYKHTREGNFANILNEAKFNPLLLYDSDQRRAWLVPTLSVLLHMTLVYNTKHDNFSGFPFACATWDGGRAAYDAILGYMGIPTTESCNTMKEQEAIHQCIREKENMWLLSNLKDTWYYLVAAGHLLRQKNGTKNMRGFDFVDIACRGTKISMREQQISPAGKCWTYLFENISMVVFCGKIGDVITPDAPDMVSTQLCAECRTLPLGNDYMATSVLCLKRIIDLQPDGTSNAKVCWQNPSNPFQSCSEESNSCIDQRVQSLTRRRKQTTLDQETLPASIGNNGAIIFGSPKRKNGKKKEPMDQSVEVINRRWVG